MVNPPFSLTTIIISDLKKFGTDNENLIFLKFLILKNKFFIKAGLNFLNEEVSTIWNTAMSFLVFQVIEMLFI